MDFAKARTVMAQMERSEWAVPGEWPRKDSSTDAQCQATAALNRRKDGIMTGWSQTARSSVG